MTIQEAKELYKKYDCSSFRMAREDWYLHLEYNKLNISRAQEKIWENELFYELAEKIKVEGSLYDLYVVYDLIEEKPEKAKLKTMAEALQYVIYDEPIVNAAVSELILGTNQDISERKGLVFGAYDIREKELAAEFLTYAVHLLHEAKGIKELEDRMKEDMEICRKIKRMLGLKADFKSHGISSLVSFLTLERLRHRLSFAIEFYIMKKIKPQKERTDRHIKDIKYIKDTEYIKNIEYIETSKLTVREIESLPKGSVIQGNLSLLNKDIRLLPDGLTVNGNLNLNSSGIKKLPDNLTVNGNLTLKSTDIEELPDNLIVRGRLNLNHTRVTALPENMIVKGSLNLSFSDIEELPDYLIVNGSLNLSHSKIRKLPEHLTVKEWLDLSDTEIAELPDNLTVEGYLKLDNTKITVLPDNLTVKGWLNMDNTGIKKLPDNLIVQGTLSLKNTELAELTDNLTVWRDLNLSCSKIKKLPDTLIIGKTLDLSHTEIMELPDNLTVGKNLNLSYTKIPGLPDSLVVGGYINISCTGDVELPETLATGGAVFKDGKSLPCQCRRLKQGECVPGKYLYADKILTHIKEILKNGNDTVYVGKIPGNDVTFDGKNYTHSDILSDG